MEIAQATAQSSLDEEKITEKRIRTLTDKGNESYEKQKQHYFHKVETAWSEVQGYLEKQSTCTLDLKSILEIEHSLTLCYDNYCKHSELYLEFLQRTSTESSLRERDMYIVATKGNKLIVENAFKQLQTSRNLAFETASRRSTVAKSLSSGSSTVSSILARKRAKAEAARAKVDYAEKEAGIRKHQASLARQAAELEAELDLISCKKEAAAAKAEADVWQLEEGLHVDRKSDLDLPLQMNTLERTKQYVVDQQSSLYELHKNVKIDSDNVEQHMNVSVPSVSPPPQLTFQPTPKTVIPDCRAASVSTGSVLEQRVTHNLDANAPPFRPNTGQKLAQTSEEYHSNSVTSELTRFLLKKELLLSRLTAFNDKPEMFGVWKASFKHIMNELSVSPIEEMDMLIKWLGPESSRHAQSIRASNINDPSKGVARLWERLHERYCAPELVELALSNKLREFPKLTVRDSKRLYDLSDILSEIESVMDDPRYRSLLAYYDSSSGVLPIANKLPHNIQEKWTTRAANYKKQHDVAFPPFTVFAEFIREISKIRNDPGFAYDQYVPSKREPPSQGTYQPKKSVSVKKTQISDESNVCPVHKTNHSLNQCRGFRAKPLQQRKKFLSEQKICYRCCNSSKHVKRTCTETVKCLVCGSDRHPAALHVSSTSDPEKQDRSLSSETHGGEKGEAIPGESVVSSNCTEICGKGFEGKSCAKIILVNVYHRTNPEKTVRTYAIIDDQSNRSLAKSDLFSKLDIYGNEIRYSLSSCAGRVSASGRIAEGCIIESLDRNTRLQLPHLIECNDIPNIKEEIPTPDIAKMYPHLSDIQECIPPLEESDILILTGRDVLEAHHVLEQRIGPSNTPYAQRLKLGWVIIGEACLGKIHNREAINVNKTYLLSNGRPSLCGACENKMDVHETLEIDSSVFLKTPNDNKPGRSVEDKEFLQLMQSELYKDDRGNWVAPLPFRKRRPTLPNNRSQAVRRANLLDRSLSKDTTKRQHMVTFMQRVFDNHHAEPAPPIGENDEVWYLPIFGVYHPQKPGQIRAVFDSSAQYEGLSLNSVLLSGPDLTNSLLNVLIRFRTEPIAVTADIQQMFHSFLVREDHRNFLRFLWYRNNDPTQDLLEFRMRVHVFGNRPSPAVANYGLRMTAETSQKQFGSDVKDFIESNFYVDDGLISLPTAREAIDLMKRTQVALKKEGNLRLHKIASNSEEVMSAFPTDDLAKDLKDLNFTDDELPLQRSLGIGWNLEKDTFTFRVSPVDKPYTRRGVLSVINSIFDPLGFAAPVVIQGKLILRKCMANNSGWDDLLPEENELEWELWKESLQFLQNVQIRRTYMDVSASLRDAVRKELHVFSDASEQAIAAVAYLKTVAANGEQHLGFVLGKDKVAPSHGHSIPRLELCGAVLAVDIYETVAEALGVTFDCVKFFTDSKVVLGYIHNETRRFFMYVTNRVDIIRKSTSPDQWSYVATDSNPADYATRSLSARNLQDSPWLVGPTYLPQMCITPENPTEETFPLVDPAQDKELKPDVQTLKTGVTSNHELGSHRFERFSSWKRLITAIALLRHIAASKRNSEQCKGWHLCSEARTVALFRDAERHVIQVVQREEFPEEYVLLNDKKALPKSSSISNLDPFIDENGMLRVGGRLRRSTIVSNEKFPLIIPKRHHIATLLVRHYHQGVFHQGRHFTEGAIRSAGYWILGGKRLVSSVIHKCVKCLKLRGKQESQKMSDLPESRLDVAPPFTYVGVDVFGPWNVVTRRTRGGQAQNKRWAVIFTCLAVRAVHIEVIEDMSSSSFISALRRFISLRGPVKQLQSDRGTNFVGATDDLGIDAINVEDTSVKQFLFNKGTIWKFNPPHSSHMGGVWERMIGTTRRILDSMMSDIETKNLTHEVLVTFFAEVTAIINARPLVPVSTDPDNPLILSPSTILTQKTQMDVAPFEDFNAKDMYKVQWRRVQYLADVFWKRWRHEYLQTLQCRRKWQFDKPNIKCGDIVLLKEKDACRNDWPVARVESVFPGEDNRVRKVRVRVMKEGRPQKASVITAFAARSMNVSDTVEVQLNTIRVADVLINGENKELDFMESETLDFKEVSVTSTTKNGTDGSLKQFSVVFKYPPIAFRVLAYRSLLNVFILTGAEKLKGKVDGLMGNYNGDLTDDLRTSNGTFIPINSSLDTIHHQVGLKWRVSESDSLFTYPRGKNHSTYQNHSFVPSFAIPTDPSDEAKEVCGNDTSCLYDYQTTGGDKDVARTTRSAGETFVAMKRRALPVVSCGFPKDVQNGYWNSTGNLESATATLMCHDGFVSASTETITCNEQGEWTFSSTSTCDAVNHETEWTATIRPMVIGVSAGACVALFVIIITYVCLKKRRKHKTTKA